MTRRNQPEAAIQAAVIEHLNRRGVPGLLFWHTPNSSKLGGKRTKDGVPLEAIRLKKLGMIAGVADLILLCAGTAYALELKTESGQASTDQTQFAARFNWAGGKAAIVFGLDQALRQLETWGLLRGSSA